MDEGCGVHLVQAQLRVGMEPATISHQLGSQLLDLGMDGTLTQNRVLRLMCGHIHLLVAKSGMLGGAAD